MIKLIWIFIGINTLALLIFVVMFLASTEGRNVDSMEKGWMTILAVTGLVVILLAAIPIRISHSPVSLFISGFFAALPSVVGLVILIANKLPSFKKEQTFAEIYYNDKNQRAIAAAIEQNDTLKLRQLIKGQNLNIQGNKVWGWDGLNYLQFAVRLHSNGNFPVNDEANKTAIRLLVEHGSAPTPALSEAIKYLSPEMLAFLLNAGADPNTHGYANSDPLLFEAIGTTPQENDIAILLVQKGANVNAKNGYEQTPLMFAAQNASTSEQWKDTWRLVRYLLEEAHADYTYTRSDGNNLASIVHDIEIKAKFEKVTMPDNFLAVAAWLQQHQVQTGSQKKK